MFSFLILIDLKRIKSGIERLRTSRVGDFYEEASQPIARFGILLGRAIEAYVLNPMIYGKHLKLNPVLTLIILYVAYHAFGLWGMLLGVPVARYFIHDVLGVPFRDRSAALEQRA